MMRFESVERLLDVIDSSESLRELGCAMAEATNDLGFQYFAITHHTDFGRLAPHSIRLHNYPANWVGTYDESDLGARDPVRRACNVTNVGFPWSRIPSMIPLKALDHQLIELGRDHGIQDGFAVPASLPGEALGSCTFATPTGRTVAPEHFPVAQLVGAFAFNRARHLWIAARPIAEDPPALTARQRECVIWMARGKSDWEISRILCVGEETVTRHLKAAREKYGAEKRTSLAVRALADRTLSFDEILAC
ncbi:LuxR family transcriptional regulator [Sphingomonas sp.]|uniref:LuxR family transcriptional regulator n=1 Tax=Sphingomonas sp. TaxID=28214 RepID=UPI003AFF7820